MICLPVATHLGRSTIVPTKHRNLSAGAGESDPSWKLRSRSSGTVAGSEDEHGAAGDSHNSIHSAFAMDTPPALNRQGWMYFTLTSATRHHTPQVSPVRTSGRNDLLSRSTPIIELCSRRSEVTMYFRR